MLKQSPETGIKCDKGVSSCSCDLPDGPGEAWPRGAVTASERWQHKDGEWQLTRMYLSGYWLGYRAGARIRKEEMDAILVPAGPSSHEMRTGNGETFLVPE